MSRRVHGMGATTDCLCAEDLRSLHHIPLSLPSGVDVVCLVAVAQCFHRSKNIKHNIPYTDGKYYVRPIRGTPHDNETTRGLHVFARMHRSRAQYKQRPTALEPHKHEEIWPRIFAIPKPPSNTRRPTVARAGCNDATAAANLDIRRVYGRHDRKPDRLAPGRHAAIRDLKDESSGYGSEGNSAMALARTLGFSLTSTKGTAGAATTIPTGRAACLTPIFWFFLPVGVFSRLSLGVSTDLLLRLWSWAESHRRLRSIAPVGPRSFTASTFKRKNGESVGLFGSLRSLRLELSLMIWEILRNFEKF
ncbi:uncharacterized protein [Physcomitrium patens]|uniref:Uncharacterized protein n=1 Tax=Physcomitrium patens TaxID=3218 RepID=A0A2K1IVT4_PHYPA|nr:uncharacterized protein LOC112273220 [Physcomitrium patens]PNR33386.1 hypothetical protein PHYPA_025330 [Physcomitrium patens]|eukprot:XP_024357468.1 uncharacterized protein LOC112273220 [Physcomitrella patens]